MKRFKFSFCTTEEGHISDSDKTWDSKQIGEFLAELFRDSFRVDEFRSYFDSALLEHYGQNADLALAEWYALGAFSFVWCLWRIYNTQEQIFPILDSFEPAVFKLLLFNTATKKEFVTVARDREVEYVQHYREVKTGDDLQKFYGRVVSHIVGTFDTNMDARGLHLAPASTCAAICHYHTGVMAAIMDVIKKIRV